MDKAFGWFMLLVVAVSQAVRADEDVVQQKVRFVPTGDERIVPEPFRLQPHEFPVKLVTRNSPVKELEYYEVTFPSPVKTPHAVNNTVHCEFYRPAKLDEPAPAVIVLHILGGDFPLSRSFCYYLGGQGVSTLFLKMPYYGPRRDPNSRVRMVTEDPHQTVRGMTQAVLDIRRAAAWLAAQEEIDDEQLGIMGISLGGIVSALAAEAEPRFGKVGLILAGGDISKVTTESKEFKKIRHKLKEQNITREDLNRIFKPIDPVTYAKNLHGRKVLMLNAKYDEIIPPACTESLWEAAGRPEIQWWPAGHISSGVFILQAYNKVGKLFRPE